MSTVAVVVIVLLAVVACVAAAIAVAIARRGSRGPADAGGVSARPAAGGSPVGQAQPGGGGAGPQADSSRETEDASPDQRSTDLEARSLRMQATHEAAAIRSEAETLAAMTKRLAEAESQAMRRAAEKEVGEAREALQAERENARRRAELEASGIVLEARRTAEQEAEKVTAAARALQAETERRERRVAEREDRIDSERERLEEREHELEQLDQSLAVRTAELDALADDYQRELERISGLTEQDAKAELLASVESEIHREAAIIIRDGEAEARATAERTARRIVADAVQRVASEQTTESVVSVMHLPGDEMKGRIIGREGRNIRAFESVTGVNVIIDDTPEAVLLSCFDPVRREIGRLTLEKLVQDGRIHPNRIEELYEQSKIEIAQLCDRAAEDAVLATGVGPLHPELMTLLGRLKYRTSYGQNVLAHLVECAHLAGIMAAELRVEPTLVKRGAFLHDIGKALTHEVQGSHAIIGADLARKYGEHADVVHAIEAHHNEVQPQTIEAVLTQAADACSGGRPGARRESLESYVQRLEQIEEIAGKRPGVEKVFAMQAGREVRVMVSPEEVDDLGAQMIARDVAKQIEEDLTYPGQIRITVVRESRATEIAR